MSGQLRKWRGVLGLGVTWGGLWAAIFAVIAIVIGTFRPEDVDPGEGPIRAGAILGGVGFLSGIAFGILLSFAESRRPLRDITLSRAAIWGALASAVFPLLTGRQEEVFVLCPLGGIVAAALVALTRKAERYDSRQPRRRHNVLLSYVLTSIRDVVNPPAESRT